MTPTPAAAALVLRVLFLFGYALLFAAGRDRDRGAARVGRAAADLVPGHHAGARASTASSCAASRSPATTPSCSCCRSGASTSASSAASPGAGPAEAATLSAYMAWVVTWDFLWFLLNPRFGWARFRKGEVWWHGRTWIGRFPVDYWSALVSCRAPSRRARASPAATRRPRPPGRGLLAGFAALTSPARWPRPLYMRWYAHMRRPDSRRARALPAAGGQVGATPRRRCPLRRAPRPPYPDRRGHRSPRTRRRRAP